MSYDLLKDKDGFSTITILHGVEEEEILQYANSVDPALYDIYMVRDNQSSELIYLDDFISQY